MWRYIFLAVAIIGFSTGVPDLIQKFTGVETDTARKISSRKNAALPKVTRPARYKKTAYNPLSGRTARTKMNRSGHFFFNSKMNGTPVKVMVDTGATGVAINRSTARRMGIRLRNSDFKYKSNTANGIAYYASAMIDEIQIGRIIVNNVRAAVLKDSSLSGTLLGMTFLRRLRKFEINRDTLILTQ